jgi:peptidoglycan/LPS O-acetylase OafA/YrhL
VAAAATTAVAGLMRLFDVTLEANGKGFPSYAFAQVSFVAALIGVGLAAVLVRKARSPRNTFLVTTLVLTALLVIPPAIIGASGATVLVLELMHVIAALIVIPAIANRLPA